MNECVKMVDGMVLVMWRKAIQMLTSFKVSYVFKIYIILTSIKESYVFSSRLCQNASYTYYCMHDVRRVLTKTTSKMVCWASQEGNTFFSKITALCFFIKNMFNWTHSIANIFCFSRDWCLNSFHCKYVQCLHHN